MAKIAVLALVFLSVGFAQQSGKRPAWAADSKVAPVTVGQAPFSSAFGSKVYFAGQPSQSDLADYAKLGVKTIINLRTPGEMERVAYDEAAAAQAAGIKYIHVPVSGGMPAHSELAKIYAGLNHAGEGKVLMHCASAARVGMIWAAYRAEEHGLAASQALEEGKAAGMKSPALDKAVREKLGVQP